MKNTKGFNLLTVIIIICIASICSGITVGVIVTNGYKNALGVSYKNITNDEKLSKFLDLYNNVANNYYEDVDKDKMLDTAIDAMLDYLGDTYTTYLNEGESKQLEERLSGTYEGIGIVINGTLIEDIMQESPAERAGLKKGDKIIKVNGIDVTDYTSTQLSALIKAKKDKNVDLVVLRDNQELEFNMQITKLSSNDATYSIDENKIGYLRLSIFSKTLDNQVRKALNELNNKGMERLIIDLRDNTGGYLEIAENIANMFLENGKLVYTLEDKDNKESYYDKTDEKLDIPIVILLNNNSASASEILASALKDSYGAVIVGNKSYGKGKVQQTYDLGNGTKAKYTTAKWLRPNGECIDEIGIYPDYEVSIEYGLDENGKVSHIIDKQLEKAIEVISTM